MEVEVEVEVGATLRRKTRMVVSELVVYWENVFAESVE